MTQLANIFTIDELKAAYRQLVMTYHPDRGGNTETMQRINYEYARQLKRLNSKPSNLKEIKPGNLVTVNKSRCIVLEVNEKYFKARSLETNSEAYFSVNTGFAMLNFKLRATI
jgi:hypothetical protein